MVNHGTLDNGTAPAWRASMELACVRNAWCGQGGLEPGTTTEITSLAVTTDGLVVEEVALRGPGWPRLWEKIRASSHLRGAQLLESGPDQARVRVRVLDCPYASVLARRGILPRMPIVVEGGKERWEVVAPRAELVELSQDLALGTPGTTLRSLRPAMEAGGLTPRQHDVLQRAIDAGYYAYPRGISLSDLAVRLGMAKSSLSQTLRAAERALIQGFTGRR